MKPVVLIPPCTKDTGRRPFHVVSRDCGDAPVPGAGYLLPLGGSRRDAVDAVSRLRDHRRAMQA